MTERDWEADYEQLRTFMLKSLDNISRCHLGPLIQKLWNAGGTGRDEARAIRSAISELDLCIRQWNEGYRPESIV